MIKNEEVEVKVNDFLATTYNHIKNFKKEKTKGELDTDWTFENLCFHYLFVEHIYEHFYLQDAIILFVLREFGLTRAVYKNCIAMYNAKCDLFSLLDTIEQAKIDSEQILFHECPTFESQKKYVQEKLCEYKLNHSKEQENKNNDYIKSGKKFPENR